MINLGICFHRPHQSLESKLRCFYVGNPARSSIEISAQIRKEIPNSFRRERPLVENFQKLLNVRTGVQHLSQRYTGLEYKNCAQCASRGYHAELFNFTWLTRCPIHITEAITTYCPECLLPWQTHPSKHMKNKCRICGELKLIDLIRAQIFHESCDYQLLNHLEEIVDSFSGLSRTILFSGVPDTELVESLKPSHDQFPSVLSVESPDAKKWFLKAKIILNKCNIERSVKGRMMYMKSFSKFTRKLIDQEPWRQDSINEVSAHILNRLDSLHACTLRASQICNSTTGKNNCSYCIAFDTWRHSLQNCKVKRTNKIDIAVYGFKNFYLSNYLCIPEPLRCIWISGSRYNQYIRTNWVQLLPHNIQKAIYELQLWTFFINILKIVELIITQTDNFTKHHPLPIPHFQVEQLCLDVQIDGTDEITVTHPKIGYGIL